MLHLINKRHRLRVLVIVVLLLLAGTALLLFAPLGSPPIEELRSMVFDAVEAPPIPTTSFGTSGRLPAELTDEQFWRMVSEFSEPGGSFIFENFLSNEESYQEVVPVLKASVGSGGVYMGVGPEQNFTYIAAIRPEMAFIIDIRRENMIELMMYKALFEMASDRADLVSLLFSRPRPAGLSTATSAEDLFRAYAAVEADQALFRSNLQTIKGRFAGHGFSLNRQDLETLDYTYNVFFSLGPNLSYSSLGYGPAGPTYRGLMTLTDRRGRNWSYLATEESFQFVKAMQQRNMVVPLVGDFAGDKALRTVGRYLHDHQSEVSAFYVSNVEQYIMQWPMWARFARNVTELPVRSSGVFVRFVLPSYASYVPGGSRWDFVSGVSSMADFIEDVNAGRSPDYLRVLRMSRLE